MSPQGPTPHVQRAKGPAPTTGPGLGGFFVQRIPPSQDYIPRDSQGPGGWARGPADPGPAPAADSAALSSTGILQSSEAPAPPFVHLHVHSNFSFLDGGSRIGELVDRAAELGQPALALTDHDGLYGAVRFAKACAKRDIQAIFGVEVCVESLTGADGAGVGAGGPLPAGANSPCRLVLLAETREGYANLCRLVSAAHLAVPDRDRPPTVTAARLREHREGLICLTGCRQGQVGRLVDAGRPAEAQTTLCALRDIFGPDHLYVELQHFGYEPHREAEAGQDGGAVYRKQRGDDGRLRHFRDDGHPAVRGGPARGGPAVRGGLDGGASRAPRDPGGLRPLRRSPPRPTDRPDLPQGHPQRLNPADYDVGFHPDGSPWILSCLAYCDRLLHLARECGLPAVLTTDAHYARPGDRNLHLVCRAAGRDEPLSGYPGSAPGVRCLRSRPELEAELETLLSFHISNNAMNVAERTTPFSATDPPLLTASPLDTPTQIAARCRVDLELGTYHFPEVAIPKGETAYSLLAKRCFRGMERFYRPVPPRAVELLDHELAMIEQMGFAHYFLVVHDIVRWARARGIACSGRGSAGNSLVCHVLDITASEPIRHNLLFERFLNPNRREMPDIDVDFCSTRRDEVIGHIYDTFGEDNVAVVANVNTMSPRMAVRIVAEAVGFAPTEINALAKNVPRHGDAGKMRDYLAGEWPELAESPLQDESRYGPLLDLVERLDGYPLHLGTHLGGFVVADRPITYYAPLQWAAKGVVVIQFNKDDVADLGLVKMDILGLRTHSAVSETVHIIRQRTGRKIAPYALAPNDPPAYEIISNGGSIGLFQLESAGQRNLATRLQEETFDDIIAAIALYRPGPLEAEMIGPFVDRRWGYEKVSLPHPAMAEALADTYGVILYQEQVLRVAQLVAGFSPAEADSLRRAMTRDKSREEMAKIGETFVHHAVARGVPEDAAREVFRQLEGFAAYGFNKSHSVCFAVISYATAYLKAHYPAEFLCAVQNNQPMGFYTPRTVLNDARRFGLAVRPLDINLSGRGFTVEDAEPPDPWAADPPGTAGEGDAGNGHGAEGAVSRHSRAYGYDPFTLAWTAAHDWGLTPDDLAELETVHGEGGGGRPAKDRLTEGRPGQIEAHDAKHDSADGHDPQPAEGIPHEQDAHSGRPGHTDTRPDSVGGADGQRTQRQVEQDETADGEEGEDQYRHQPSETVGQFERDGEPDLEQSGKHEEQPGHRSLPVSGGQTMLLYHPFGGSRTNGDSTGGDGGGGGASTAAAMHATPPGDAHPGDLALPRAHRARARAGVAPDACLAPAGALAPGAGQALRVGLRYLKQMSERALKAIETERRYAPFTSFEDFYLRTRVEYPVAENLIRVGAFDSLEPDRTELLWRLPLLRDRLDALARAGAGRRGQLRAFLAPPERAGLERTWTVEDKVRV